MDKLFGIAFVAGLFLFALLIVLFSYRLRQRKYRQIANVLGADFQPQGLFKSGTILGTENRRKYSIENKEGARGSGSWTIIKMQCANKGIPLHIHGRFFKEFPNWNFAFTEGERTQRLFVVNVTIQNAGIPLDEKYKIEVQGLFQEFALLNIDLLKKGEIRIEQDSISFVVHRVLKNAEAIRQLLSVLSSIADRIESSPIA